MKNTLLNIVEAVRTFQMTTSQPNVSIGEVTRVGKLLEQRLDEMDVLIKSFPDDEDMLAWIASTKSQVEHSELLVQIIQELHGDMAAMAYINAMKMVARAINGFIDIYQKDEIAQLERA